MGAISLLPISLVLLIVSQGELLLRFTMTIWSFISRCINSDYLNYGGETQNAGQGLPEFVLTKIMLGLGFSLLFLGVPHQAKSFILNTNVEQAKDPFAGWPMFQNTMFGVELADQTNRMMYEQ